MPILPGKRLGPYEILSSVGAGGMGEVYRARDTRLDRIVAIKVLPTHLADRSELRERFEREAKTIASLNHPHICTLYDIGHQDEFDFLVMEYLEGETLAQRLLKGALPLEQVLQYAIEVSDALDKAHRKGVTHRDLKPGNIMLTKSGTKLLDFGLAKLRQEAAPSEVSLSNLSTKDDTITAQGMILGTLQYMAPEQLEGKADQVDARTDIFAFGVVVYEMATGKKAFEGKSQASVIGAILKDNPPPMSSLQPMTPPMLDRIVKRCLAKEPNERWQSAADLADQLKWISESGSQGSGTTTLVHRVQKNSPKILALAGLSLVACAIVGLAAWFLKPAPPKPVTRFAISLPPGQQLSALDSPAVVLSPDGTRLVYVAAQGGTQQLYLRAMENLEAKPILGTEGAVAPFFSPDSQWVGFFAGGRLKKVSVSGGAAVTLCNAEGGSIFYSGAWGLDDNIVFAFNYASNGGVWKVSAAGGVPQQLITMRPGDAFLEFPETLPSGKAVLFTVGSASGLQVGIRSQQTGDRHRRDLIGGTRPTYAPTGHLVYAQAGTLMAVPFDPQRLGINGSPVPVLEGVFQSPTTGVAQYSVSNTGSVAYLTGIQGTGRKLVWVDRKGIEQSLPAPSHSYRTPRLSPDGQRVAVAIAEQAVNVWLYNLARETLTRLTFDGNSNTPIWTPDGKRIAFNSSVGGPVHVFWHLADGSGTTERLTPGEDPQVDSSWSPDGQVLAFVEFKPGTGRDIWILRINGDRKPEPFLQTQFNETAPSFSPDGHWLAYASDESGHYEIYVQPYPGPGGKWQISTEGGTEPVWGRNGEIFYRGGDKMIAVETTTRPTFSADKPKVLFAGQYVPSLLTMPNYDVSPNGQRFLMIKEDDQPARQTQINIVLNWFEELKQKVPTGKK